VNRRRLNIAALRLKKPLLRDTTPKIQISSSERKSFEMDEFTGQTAVLIIAHGSRHQAANDDLHALAERFSAQAEYPIVEACFLELAEPDITSGGSRCADRGATCVLMIPYFLSAGVHLLRDLTRAREELSRRHPGIEFRLGPPLGPHPLLDALLAARICELERGEVAPVVVASDSMHERYAPMDEDRPGAAPADHS
jgi:sirohydrochlorin ferrochelatase